MQTFKLRNNEIDVKSFSLVKSDLSDFFLFLFLLLQEYIVMYFILTKDTLLLLQQVGQITAPLTTATSSPGLQQQQQPQGSAPRGPRTLILRRGENGFGFTLRHFIVYPPESCYVS